MSTGDVNEATRRMLAADDHIERQVALGQLLERLARVAGQPADRLGVIAAAVMLLWQASEREESLREGGKTAKAMLSLAELGMVDLVRLASTGRALLGAALELQGQQLLAAPRSAGYMPQVGDWAIWLDMHVVRVAEVGEPREGHTREVWIRTAGGNRLAVSPKELELYRRDGE